jgi:hypothetical protein
MDQPVELFTCFNDLTPVIQDKTFACSQPHDKNNWQKTNKEWYKRGSINVPTVYKLAMHDPFCASETDKKRILLSACYNKQYYVVQNILNQTDNRTLFHHILGTHVWDLYGVAEHIQDKKMLQLLKDNKVSSLIENTELLTKLWEDKCRKWPNITENPPQCTPTDLQMACFSGDSDAVARIIKNGGLDKNMHLAIHILLYMDSAQCFEALLDSRSTSFLSFNDRLELDTIFRPVFLHTACLCKSLRVLRSLLYKIEFDINMIVNDHAIFDLYSIVNGKFLVKGELESKYADVNDILKERISKDKVSGWSSFCVYLNNLENIFL